MKKSGAVICILMMLLSFQACKDEPGSSKEKSAKSKHHLNIPATGIESLMEANTSKIIEGTQGSIVLTIGEVTRKKADISIKRNDRILDERLIGEDENLTFDYEGNMYMVSVKKLKKPLIGAGKAEISVTLQ